MFESARRCCFQQGEGPHRKIEAFSAFYEILRSPVDSSSSLHAQNLNFVSWDVVCCVGGDVGQKLVI